MIRERRYELIEYLLRIMSTAALSNVLVMTMMRHPLDPDNLMKCHKCFKRKNRNIRCRRYVQCIIGEDETSNYVEDMIPLLEKLTKEMLTRKI